MTVEEYEKKEIVRRINLYGSELQSLKSRIMTQEKVAKTVLKKLKKMEKRNGRNIKKA